MGVYAGVSTLVINYRNQRGGLVNEVLIFDGDLVTSGHGTYSAATSIPQERRCAEDLVRLFCDGELSGRVARHASQK